MPAYPARPNPESVDLPEDEVGLIMNLDNLEIHHSLSGFTSSVVRRLIHEGNVGSVAEAETLFRTLGSHVFLLAQPLRYGATTASLEASPSSCFTSLIQDPGTMPQYTMGAELRRPEQGTHILGNGLHYASNFERLRTTGILVDLIVRD